MGENNWLLVKFQVKDPKSTSGAQGITLSNNGDLTMKKDIVECPQCGTDIDIEDKDQANVWFDTGDEVLLVPRELLDYLEDSVGILGIS